MAFKQEEEPPVQSSIHLEQFVLDISRTLDNRDQLSEQSQRQLQRLLSLLGSEYNQTDFRVLSSGSEYSFVAGFSNTLQLPKLAEKNPLLLRQNYGLDFFHPDDIQKLVKGEVFVIGGFTDKKISDEDISKLEKSGIYLKIQETEDGKYYVRVSNEAGYLIQQLANDGVSVTIRGDSTLLVSNNLYLPFIPPAELRRLRTFVREIEELQKEGKSQEALERISVLVSILGYYRRLEEITDLQSQLSKQPDVRLSDHEFAKLKEQYTPAEFKNIFGCTFAEFEKVGASLKVLAQWKLEHAKISYSQAVELGFSVLSGAVSEKKIDGAKKHEMFAEYQLTDVNSIIHSISVVQEARLFSDGFEKIARADEVTGKKAKEVIQEEAAKLKTKLDKPLWRMETAAKLLAFSHLEANYYSVFSDEAELKAVEKDISKHLSTIENSRNEIIGDTELAKSYAEFMRLRDFAVDYEKELKDLRGRVAFSIASYPYLEDFEKFLFDNVLAQAGCNSKEESSDFFENLINSIDPKKTRAAIELVENNPDEADSLKNTDEARQSQVTSLLKQLQAISWRQQVTNQEESFFEVLGILVERLDDDKKTVAELKQLEAETRQNGFDQTRAEKRYFEIIHDYGIRAYKKPIQDALDKLSDIDAMLDEDSDVESDQRQLVAGLLRQFKLSDATTGITLKQARELLSKFEKMSGKDLLGLNKDDPEVKNVIELVALINTAHKFAIPVRLERVKAWHQRRIAQIERGHPMMMAEGSKHAQKYRDEERKFIVDQLVEQDRDYKQKLAEIVRDGKDVFALFKKISGSELNSLEEDLNDMKLVATIKGYEGYIEDFLDDIYSPAATEVMDKLLDEQYKELPWYSSAGGRTIRFLEKYSGPILWTAAGIGFVAGLFNSAGIGSVPEAAAARVAAGAGIRALVRRYGARAVVNLTTPSLKRGVLGGTIEGLGLGGKMVAGIAAVPVVAGGYGAFFSETDQEKEFHKSMLHYGVGQAIKGTIVARGNVLSSASGAMRVGTILSESLVLGGTGANLYLTFADSAKGEKTPMGTMEKIALGGDILYVGLAMATPFGRATYGFFANGIKGVQEVGALRGLGRAFAGGAKGFGAGFKTIYTSGHVGVQFGDVLLTGMIVGEPIMVHGMESLVLSSLSEKEKEEYKEGKKTQPPIYLMQDLPREKLAPDFVQANYENYRLAKPLGNTNN